MGGIILSRIINAGYEIGECATLREGTIIYPKTKIGKNFNSGHYAIIREETIIGDNCSIGSHTEIGHHVVLGNNVRIHSSCFIPEYTEIFADCWLGPNVTITNTFHPLCEHAKECLKRTAVKIMQGAVIGAGSIIMPGIIIGRDAVVGAGSLVNKSIDSNSVVFGHPIQHYTYRGNLNCKFDASFKPYEEQLNSIPPTKQQTLFETNQ
jgi:acetyltransferase-like isoleucine patch superfamily enzyme